MLRQTLRCLKKTGHPVTESLFWSKSDTARALGSGLGLWLLLRHGPSWLRKPAMFRSERSKAARLLAAGVWETLPLAVKGPPVALLVRLPLAPLTARR